MLALTTTHGFTYQFLVAKLLDDGVIANSYSLANDAATNENPITAIARQSIFVNNSKSKHKLNEAWLTNWLAHHYNQPFQSINLLDLPKATSILEAEFIRQHKILPLKIESTETGQQHWHIAHSNPLNLAWLHLIERFHNYKVIAVMSEPSRLSLAIDQVYLIDKYINDASKEQTDFSIMDATIDKDYDEKDILEGQNTSQIANRILSQSVLNNASDIHIEPIANKPTRIRLRVDGLLREFYQLPTDVAKSVINRFKILAHLDIAESHKAQDGRFSFNIRGIKIDARIATIPILQGEKVTIRLLNSETICQDFATLGMAENTLENWHNLISLSSGLILLAGPTGCGKSTTLYTSLLHISSANISVATVEDPVEYVVDGFNQTQINESKGITFTSGLKSLLRQDPDVIMIGEIRDAETAKIAIQAALTGHLVFASLHAGDCNKSILRLLDLGISKTLLGQALLGILSQRVVRKICSKCLAQNPKINNCNHCHQSGYAGRIGIFQLVSNLPTELNDIKITSFMQLGMDLVAQKVTTTKEINRVCLGD